MSKVLDLSAFRDETLDITMPEGYVLHIVKPSQKMVIKMIGLRELTDSKDGVKIINGFNEIVVDVLNNNKEHKKFTIDDVAAYSFDMKTAIINAYSSFISELQSNPT